MLLQAGIERAHAVIACVDSDAENIFITLTARNMRPTLRIIARAEDPATEKKLKQAGANEIILPAFAGGMQIANSITHPSLDSILKEGGRHLKNDLKELGVEIIEHPIVAHGVDDRKTLHQLLKGVETDCMVLAVKKPDGTLLRFTHTGLPDATEINSSLTYYESLATGGTGLTAGTPDTRIQWASGSVHSQRS